MNQKQTTAALRLAFSLALVWFFVACSPQARNNPMDPGGTAYVGPGSSGRPVGFLPGAPALTPPANGWDKAIGLSWPQASNVASYRVYVSTSATRPTAASVENIIATNTTASLAGAGTNTIWIEALPLTSGAPSAFLQTNFAVRSGWKMDGAVGGASVPSIRCLNVPVGQTKIISFPGSIGMNMTPVSVSCALRTASVSGNLEVVVMLTNGLYSCPWTNMAGNLSTFTSHTGTVVGGTPPMGACTVVISVKNLSDTDDFNALWVDDIDVMTAIYSEGFAALLDNMLTGHTEN